eukprot:307620-Pleurochrysis_carterae.AAC.1
MSHSNALKACSSSPDPRPCPSNEHAHAVAACDALENCPISDFALMFSTGKAISTVADADTGRGQSNRELRTARRTQGTPSRCPGYLFSLSVEITHFQE